MRLKVYKKVLKLLMREKLRKGMMRSPLRRLKLSRLVKYLLTGNPLSNNDKPPGGRRVNGISHRNISLPRELLSTPYQLEENHPLHIQNSFQGHHRLQLNLHDNSLRSINPSTR